MQNTKIKFGLIGLLLFCAGMLATCEFMGNSTNKSKPLQDTTVLSQWKKEKAMAIAQYEVKLKSLQTENDNLKKSEVKKLEAINNYRAQAKRLQDELKTSLSKNDTVKISIGSIRPKVDSLMIAEQLSDTACDAGITGLKQIVSKQDSSIALLKEQESLMKDVHALDQLQIQQLNEQVKEDNKRQRKKNIQAKFLQGALLILTGITTSLLISNAIK